MALMRLGAAITMGIAIAGMHYAGMEAAQFPMSTMVHHHGINGSWLAILVSVVALAILGITLLVSMFDARLQARTSLLASSLAEANRELAQLALHDTLTRLPNRILLEDRLDQAISKADREGSPFALMFMDLDGFKTVNDAYGHDVGDNLLVAVTQRLLLQLKGQYTLARIGGDEFVLLAETTMNLKRYIMTVRFAKWLKLHGNVRHIVLLRTIDGDWSAVGLQQKYVTK